MADCTEEYDNWQETIEAKEAACAMEETAYEAYLECLLVCGSMPIRQLVMAVITETHKKLPPGIVSIIEPPSITTDRFVGSTKDLKKLQERIVKWRRGLTRKD